MRAGRAAGYNWLRIAFERDHVFRDVHSVRVDTLTAGRVPEESLPIPNETADLEFVVQDADREDVKTR
jgi:hypothetical protein